MRVVNSRNDRETPNYTAVDYVLTITRALNATYSSSSSQYSQYGLGPKGGAATTYPVSAFITDLVYLKGCEDVKVDRDAIHVRIDSLTTMRT